MCVGEEEILKLVTGTSVPHQREDVGVREVKFTDSVFLLESVFFRLSSDWVGITLSFGASSDFHRETCNFSPSTWKS